MSDTVSSQFNAKNQDDQVRSLIGERGRWTMSSGQMPPGGAGGYPPTQTHHLPPTVPNPTPNASSLPQRLRMPPNTPPAHQHMPPWRHSPAASQATGLGALPSGLHTYFGSPHLAGRAGMTAWQAAAAKPAGAHSAALGAHAANPLFSLQSLQMMVNADLPGSAPAPDYQQETMDLSSHSEARRSPKKDTLLRNGGNNCIMSNGEMAATAADLSAAKSSPLDSVSVIAQNPLRETVPEVLNCSSKPDVRSEKAAEFPSEPHTKVDKASPLPSPASPEPAASAPPVPEQKTTELNRAVQTSVPENKPTELNQPTHTPVIENKSTELIRAVHTPDNVESILENMFRIQEDKQQTPANSSSPLVTPHSVIVSNDTRTTHHDNSISVSNISKEVPVSSPPEKINEQKLIEILKVEEDGDHLREGVSKKDSKEDMEEVKKENVIETKHDESKTDSVSVKDEVVMIAEDVVEKPNVTSSTVEDVTMDNDDNTVVISESEDESNTTRESSAVKSESKVKDEPDSMFTEVESELEKMFAGIVEPGSEVPVKEEVAGGSGVQGNKRRGRPKGALGAARRSSDTSFSGVDSASKKRKGKESETGKKGGKKVRIDVESSNQLARKGRPTSLAGTDQGKSRGPVVHVEGSRDNPTSVVVVNGTRGQDEDDANEKSGAAKASFRKQRAIFQTEAKTRGAQSAGLYNSTLSSRYDSLVADSTWLCVLCKRGPHYEPCAGDLFGPYVVQLSPPTASGGGSLPPPCDYDLAAEQKRRAGPGKMAAASLRATGGGEGFAQKAAKKHKRSVSMDVDRQMSGLVPMEGGAGEYEVWVHEACAVWAPGVYMIGARLIGLQDAVADAIKTRCSGCGEPGASIGCIARGCRQLLHLGCARRAAWHLDQHNFISKCSQHANTLLHTEYGRR